MYDLEWMGEKMNAKIPDLAEREYSKIDLCFALRTPSLQLRDITKWHTGFV